MDGSKFQGQRVRDVRLDFFRGIGMFIIFIAHVPNNPFSRWIPARFGYSDATEIFVFCSGMASAIAFAAVFDKRSFWLGSARIAHRTWQVYWAHIGLFLASAALLVFADYLLASDGRYIKSLNLTRFIGSETGPCLVGLFTLTYVPNLFDILPMYLVILLMIPLIMALSRIHVLAPLIASVALWAVAQFGYLKLPAEPWSERQWFFNPFAWQLVFFTGFAFIRGWLPRPPVHPVLIGAAVTVLLLSMMQVLPSIRPYLPLPDAWKHARGVLFNKTSFGFLRYLHFLSLAYIAFILAGPNGERLRGRFVDVCRKVGQQALAVFIVGILLALIGGIILKETSYAPAAIALVNFTGCAILIAVAYIVSWFKRSPWKAERVRAKPVTASS